MVDVPMGEEKGIDIRGNGNSHAHGSIHEDVSPSTTDEE
jgi:hypothetical protein